MGLDMYLYVNKYVSRSDYGRDANGMMTSTENDTFRNLVTILDVHHLIDRDDSAGMQVKVPVGYWRKANAVHTWIVNNCAGGVDECQEIYINPDRAQVLIDLCEQVIADPSKGAELLPTQSGFFFGSLEYDEYYISDLKHTVEVFRKALSESPDDSIYYQASW